MIVAGIYLYRSDKLKNVLEKIDFEEKKRLLFIKPKEVTCENMEPGIYGKQLAINELDECLENYALDTRTCIVVNVPKEISDYNLIMVCNTVKDIIEKYQVRVVIALKPKYMKFVYDSVKTFNVDLMKSSANWITDYSILFD